MIGWISSDDLGLPGNWGVGPVALCSCSVCGAASTELSNAPTPHVMANALSQSDNRGAERLVQYRGDDGYWHFSGDRNIDAVLIGTRWTGTTLTFSFPDNGAVYGSGYNQPSRLLPFNEAQKTVAREAFAMVSGYTNLTFVEVAADAIERPTFRLASTSDADTQTASGYFPMTPNDRGGDIWFGRSNQPYYENPQPGNWGYGTILHEIGHTLGLKHGHSDYTADDLNDYFETDTPFFGSRALEYARDGQAWSLMTYTTGPKYGGVFNGDQYSQPQTYMMYDIAALQYLYGANYSTNAGDTVYRWSAETGELSINGVSRGKPTGNKVFETIWDGGGNDTYDFSDYRGDLNIDLRPGKLTTLTEEQQPNMLGFQGDVALFAGNIGNALLFQGNIASLIENATGGIGDDQLTGNQANNRLEGGAGNDILFGGRGNDQLIGGAGNDIADLSDARTALNITLNNGAADIIVANGGDRDLLRGIEGVIGSAQSDTLIGDRADNYLSGGRGGRDYLNGGDGNDTLIGALDTVQQVGKDVMVKPVDAGNYWSGAAIDLDGWFDLLPDPLVDLAETIPHATVHGTGPAAGVDVYRVTAKAGARGIFDLDGVLPGYHSMRLTDEQGNVIAMSFPTATTDAGSRNGGAPYMEVVFPDDGVYFIAVGGVDIGVDEFGEPFNTFGAFAQQTDYVLNVSVESARVDDIVTAIASGRFYGGAGDDVIVGSSGDDLISGGSGLDTLSYETARNGVAVDLTRTSVQDTRAGRDIIAGIENLIGSRHDDTLRGDAGANTIVGGGATDTLDGGAGRDTLSFKGVTQDVTFSLGAQGSAQRAYRGSTVTATNFEDIEGGAGNDMLTGDARANVIRGAAGDDVLDGSAEGTVGGVDTLDGGEGYDTAAFYAHAGGVRAVLLTGGRGEARNANGALLSNLIAIEALSGGFGADVLIGNDAVNRLDGLDGNDWLLGGSGDDRLDGGDGDDLIHGGDGVDLAVFDGGDPVTVDLAIAGPQDTGRGMDTLVSIENLRGGWGADVLRGNDGNNTFVDTYGNDSYDGRGGSDTVDYSSAWTKLEVDLRLTGRQQTYGGGEDVLTDIENIIGGNNSNTLTGNDAQNRLVGGASADGLFGGLGEDRLEGGAGDDLLVGDGSEWSVNLDGLSMNDTLLGGTGSDVLVGGEGDDVLLGGTGNDVLVGGTALVQGVPGTYRVERLSPGYGGRDTLDGGEGLDFGVLDLSGIKESVTIDNRHTAGTNFIYYNGVAHGSLTSIEAMRFQGGDGDDRVETAEGYDNLRGGAGDDYLSAGAGDDTVNGGAGGDVLDGGEGRDLLSYEGATAGITIDLRRTDAQDTGGGGIDTVRNFEDVVTTVYDDVVHGNDTENTIRDRAGGADQFFGHGGNDLIGVARLSDMAASVVYLDGGDGNDAVDYIRVIVPTPFPPRVDYNPVDTVTLIGGAGNDSMAMIGQKIGVLDAGAGDDMINLYIGGNVFTSVDITLGSGMDTLTIKDTDNTIIDFDHRNKIVRDFVAGDAGDRVNVGNVLLGSFTGENPFTTGQMRLLQDGADTLIQIDPDAAGTAQEWRTLLVFQNTDADDFTAHNFFRRVDDGWNPAIETEWDPHAAAAMAVTGDTDAVLASFDGAAITGRLDTGMSPIGYMAHDLFLA